MTERDDPRPGEVTVELPGSFDAGVYFIGRIRTPFTSRADCPKNTARSAAIGRVELEPRYVPALQDLERCSHAILLYWMHEARRDLILQVPGYLGQPAIVSPNQPIKRHRRSR